MQRGLWLVRRNDAYKIGIEISSIVHPTTPLWDKILRPRLVLERGVQSAGALDSKQGLGIFKMSRSCAHILRDESRPPMQNGPRTVIH